MVRVCHIVEAAGGGSGQVVVDLAAHGAEAGDDVTVVYSPSRAEPRFVGGLQAIPGITLLTSEMQRKVGPHDARDALRLWALLRKQKAFDIIHSHSSKAGALARLIRPLLPRTKQVYTPHAFMSMAPGASPLYGWIERMLAFFCEAILCTSEQERQHALGQLLIHPRRVHVVLNGVRLDYPATRAQARARMGLAEDVYVAGFVGRLVAQKNPLRLLRAFARAAKPDMLLAVVGEGPLREQMQDEAAMLGIAPRVMFFTGNGRDFMPGFDCLVCSSDYESFGLVLVEALAAGIPLVTTRVGVAEDVVMPTRNGELADDFTDDALAAALGRLLARPAAEQKAAVAAMQSALDAYSSLTMYQRTQEIYRRVLSRK